MKIGCKKSYYNFIYDEILDDSDETVIYNARTGALAVLDRDKSKKFKSYINGDMEIEDEVFLENLLKCGFLIPENLDEKKYIETSAFRGRFDSSKMSLTIAPTMACNFRCIYCFEKGQYENQVMSDETVGSILEYIKEHAEHLHLLDITWYGGEPLLAMEQIEKLSTGIMEIVNKYNIQYNSSIVTNGYLLNKENTSRLKGYGINDIQITIDGIKEIHDKRRPLISGQGTFNVIMKNLIDINGILPVFVRINIDNENCK